MVDPNLLKELEDVKNDSEDILKKEHIKINNADKDRNEIENLYNLLKKYENEFLEINDEYNAVISKIAEMRESSFLNFRESQENHFKRLKIKPKNKII